MPARLGPTQSILMVVSCRSIIDELNRLLKCYGMCHELFEMLSQITMCKVEIRLKSDFLGGQFHSREDIVYHNPLVLIWNPLRLLRRKIAENGANKFLTHAMAFASYI